MDQFMFASNLSEAKINQLSRFRKEPERESKKRLEAFRVFQLQNWPTNRDEEWRRSNLKYLDSLDFSLDWSINNALKREISQLTANGYLAKLEQVDSGRTELRTSSQLPSGVIFDDMEQVLREHPDLPGQCEELISPEDGKFSAFNKAFWNKGVFLWVPKNTEVTIPLYCHLLMEGQKWGVLPLTKVVVGESSRVTLIDDYSSADQSDSCFCNSVSEIHLKANSQLTYVNVQRWGKNVYNILRQKAKLEKDARLTTLNISLGGECSRSEIETVMAGSGAYAKMFGLALGRDKQYFEQHTKQSHGSPQTTSDLLFKTVLFDQSRMTFSGMIQIEKQAQKSDAYQANRNLLLSDKARVDTLPKLEILANDVRCTHGATAGPIDPEQFFYLTSRGIAEQEAKFLIASGFFQEILGQFPDGEFKETIHSYLNQKILS